jgi:hypothetical protein
MAAAAVGVQDVVHGDLGRPPGSPQRPDVHRTAHSVHDMDQILEAGRRAPSAGNWQPWDFVVVTGDRWYPRRQASTGWTGAVEREDSAAAGK